MIFFITVLRALAACLITNAHYTGVYPTDIIANGGLVGDVLFFAVSGYCLYNIKVSFPKWYGKRLVGCYLRVLLITALYMALGFYSLSEHSFAWWYIYPTYYHFVASIIILYIPYYIIIKIPQLRKRIPLIMLGIFVVYLVVYIFIYDKSYYHIDTVREPMIRFLFMESMLLGAWFRQNDAKIRNQLKWYLPVILVVTVIMYFASKLLFARVEAISALQIINQVLIFVLLYFILRVFAGLDEKLNRFPKIIKNILGYLAQITLEIYVVQYVIIEQLRSVFGFPLNWFLLTVTILLAATILHYITVGIYKISELVVEKIKTKLDKSKVDG